MPTLVQNSNHLSFAAQATPSSRTYTFTNPPVAGNFIQAITYSRDASGFSTPSITVTDNQGNTYSKLQVLLGTLYITCWYCTNIRMPNAGGLTLTFANTGVLEFSAQEFSGVDWVNPIKVYKPGIASSTTSLALTTNGGNGLPTVLNPTNGDTVVAALALATTTGTLSFTVPTSSTTGSFSLLNQQLYTTTGRIPGTLGYAVAATPGDQNVTYTFPSGDALGLIYVLQGPLQKRIRCVIDGSAQGATGVVATVYLPGSTPNVLGAKLGEFSTYNMQNGLDTNGHALLYLPATDGALSTNLNLGQTVMVTVKGANNSINYGTPFYFNATVESGST